MELTSRRALVLVALAGIIIPGVLDFTLVQYGYSGVGSFVWTVGYGGAVIAVWYGWLRPLNITGDTGESRAWTVDADDSTVESDSTDRDTASEEDDDR